MIACARNHISEIANNTAQERLKKKGTTHVLFIIQLPRQRATLFGGYQGNPWVCIHIDDLRTPQNERLSPLETLCASISDRFYSIPREVVGPGKCGEVKATGYYERLHTCIQAATSKVQYSGESRTRAVDLLGMLLKLIPQKPGPTLGKWLLFARFTLFHITSLIFINVL